MLKTTNAEYELTSALTAQFIFTEPDTEVFSVVVFSPDVSLIVTIIVITTSSHNISLELIFVLMVHVEMKQLFYIR